MDLDHSFSWLHWCDLTLIFIESDTQDYQNRDGKQADTFSLFIYFLAQTLDLIYWKQP